MLVDPLNNAADWTFKRIGAGRGGCLVSYLGPGWHVADTYQYAGGPRTRNPPLGDIKLEVHALNDGLPPKLVVCRLRWIHQSNFDHVLMIFYLDQLIKKTGWAFFS